MSELFHTFLFVGICVLIALYMEEKISPLPTWTGPIFLYLVLPFSYVLIAGIVVIIFGYYP